MVTKLEQFARASDRRAFDTREPPSGIQRSSVSQWSTREGPRSVHWCRWWRWRAATAAPPRYCGTRWLAPRPARHRRNPRPCPLKPRSPAAPAPARTPTFLRSVVKSRPACSRGFRTHSRAYTRRLPRFLQYEPSLRMSGSGPNTTRCTIIRILKTAKFKLHFFFYFSNGPTS